MRPLIQHPLTSLPLEEEEQEESVPFGEAVWSGIRRQSLGLNLILNQREDYAYNPEYDYREDEANRFYPAEEMVESGSAEEAAAIRAQIDQEREDMENVSKSWGGTLGEVIGAIGPEVFIGGAAATAAKLGWKGIVAADVAVVTGSEALLQQQQRLRTMEESVFNIGATAAGGLLLGAAGQWFSRNRNKPEVQSVLSDDPDQLLRPPEIDPEDLEAVEDSVGAMRAVVDPDDPEFSFAGNRAMWAFALGPGQRLATSKSKTAREVSAKLAESSFMLRGAKSVDAEGNPVGPETFADVGVSVEGEAQQMVGDIVNAVEEMNRLRKGTEFAPRNARESFQEQVGGALIRGDTSDNPVVQQAAELLRKRVYEPIQKAAQEAGILPRASDDVMEIISEKSGADEALLARASEYKNAFDEWITLPDNVTQTAGKPRPVRPEDSRITEDIWEQLEMAVPKMPRYGRSYFNRTYRADKIYERYGELMRLLEHSFKRAGVEGTLNLRQAAQDTIDNMLGGVPLLTGGRTAGRLPSAIKRRVIPLMDTALEPYMEMRGDVAAVNHAVGLAPYIAMKKVFKTTDMQSLGEKIKEEYQELVARAKTTKERRELDKERERDLRLLDRMIQRVEHRVDRTTDIGGPNSGVAKGIRTMQAVNVATQLGGVVPSSAVDVVRPLIMYGLRSYATGLAKSVQYIFSGEASKRLTKRSVQRIGVALERTLNRRGMDMIDYVEGASKFSDFLIRWWGKLSLFNLWTDVMEQFTSQVASDWTLRMAKKVAAGETLSQSEAGAISRMGLNLGDLEAVAREHAKLGSPGGDLSVARTMQWQNAALAQKFEAAIGTDVRRAIVRIGAADKPLWMDSLTGQLASQYMSFGIAATNKMLVAGMQQRDMKLLGGVLVSLWLGAQVDAFKGWLRGKEPETLAENPAAVLLGAIDRTGIAGVYNIGLRMASHVSGITPTRYLQRDVEGMFGILGPTASTLGNVARAGIEAKSGDWEDAGEHLARATPIINNTLHIRQLLNRMGAEEDGE